ncbi:hypothetical protein ER308_10260 [Egibacter rhizosphaerae]|uniref:Uncharacterized protein n=1 Tax=Egibacter rhizosphaerae TaxID=1670831 RepID=A0A411YF63_9ACTN|nr:hypothetical protein [Egibacter rhizosphaerae]QBI19904.1 hypothetical protein ER308_10260 [Egibacter rhizosphaerae]
MTESATLPASLAECEDGACELPSTYDDAEAAHEALADAGWTDGHPVRLPTARAVRRLLDAHGLDPDDGIGGIPPVWGDATYGRIAANAVMAGCPAETFPAVVAALRAMKDDRFNLHGVQCTTHVVAPLLLVNGPARDTMGVNSGHNCLGQGTRANAAIGRAVRLAMVNIGGAAPGTLDKATFGHPGKYAYLFGENEEESPFSPFHTTRGFDPQESAITVFPGEAPHNINNHAADPMELLGAIAHTMASLGNNNMYVSGEVMVVLGVDHAGLVAEAGFKRHTVQEFLFENARLPVGLLRTGGMYGHDVDRNLWPRWVDRRRDDAMVPIVRRPDDIHVVVAGGVGPHSLFIPGWGTRAATEPIALS